LVLLSKRFYQRSLKRPYKRRFYKKEKDKRIKTPIKINKKEK